MREVIYSILEGHGKSLKKGMCTVTSALLILWIWPTNVLWGVVSFYGF